jgi:hypothetical protein
MQHSGFLSDILHTDYQYIVLDIVVGDYGIYYKLTNVNRNNKKKIWRMS